MTHCPQVELLDGYKVSLFEEDGLARAVSSVLHASMTLLKVYVSAYAVTSYSYDAMVAGCLWGLGELC